MRLVFWLGLLVISLACDSVFAGEESKADTNGPLLNPAVSVGFSYPLVFSASLAALLPLGRQEKDNVFPTSPSLRIEGEIGLGGGSAAGGLYIPAGGSFAVNIKAERMRTWLLTWNEEVNRTFDGGVAEFVLLGHVPGKIGLGYFRDTDPLNTRRESFTYVFFGVGW
jgi:hypothetical protein